LKNLNKEEFDPIAQDIIILKQQAKDIAKELQLPYHETLLLLILREAVIVNRRLEQWINVSAEK
jgi:hypothetical protein